MLVGIIMAGILLITLVGKKMEHKTSFWKKLWVFVVMAMVNLVLFTIQTFVTIFLALGIHIAVMGFIPQRLFIYMDGGVYEFKDMHSIFFLVTFMIIVGMIAVILGKIVPYLRIKRCHHCGDWSLERW